ncbi:tetratricopeptide repeat protein [Streptomyces bauhiniae]|uniref:tetratricopeptide repeat protein n=1 Tax=Streptomyces bauhiniae TaxID=2340725 RepID=UPI00365247BC
MGGPAPQTGGGRSAPKRTRTPQAPARPGRPGGPLRRQQPCGGPGDAHPDTLHARDNLANILIDNGDHEEATTLLTRCHTDCTRVFGPPDPHDSGTPVLARDNSA